MNVNTNVTTGFRQLLAEAEQAEGVRQVRPTMEHKYGRFARVTHGEGNLVELWQPGDGA